MVKIEDKEFRTNFSMSIHSIKKYGYYYYLFNEYFDVEKISINQDNFYDYFEINHLDVVWYFILYKDIYCFRSYVPLTLNIGADSIITKKTIVYSPSNGDHIKIDNIGINYYQYDVIIEEGYIYGNN